MCRGPYGLSHRNYSPSRSVTLSYWRRLPTIFEATDNEMSTAEIRAGETLVKENLEQDTTDAARLLGEKEINRPPQKAAERDKTAKEKSMRYKICFGKSGVIETAEATLFQQVKDELKYFLKTPYAEFFPENTGTSSLETCCLPDSARKKQSKISDTTGMQSDRFSEIAAWLEFFG